MRNNYEDKLGDHVMKCNKLVKRFRGAVGNDKTRLSVFLQDARVLEEEFYKLSNFNRFSIFFNKSNYRSHYHKELNRTEAYEHKQTPIEIIESEINEIKRKKQQKPASIALFSINPRTPANRVSDAKQEVLLRESSRSDSPDSYKFWWNCFCC